MTLSVTIHDDQDFIKLDQGEIYCIVECFFEVEQITVDEVSLNFVNTETICNLHSEYFDDPSTTDCITFPIDLPGHKPYCLLGEVFVCPETAIQYSKEHGCSPYNEITLYIIHGLLHLLGYDDIDPEERESMRQAEAKHMNHLAAKDLILK